MNVLMLTWEYPPRIIGGISTHVYNVSKSLARRGVSVHVITCSFPNTPAEEVVDGVHLLRVENSQLLQGNFLLWIYHLNSQMIKRGAELLTGGKFDLIHAHDWVVGRAALELRNRYDVPLISTIHATEVGRGGPLEDDYRKKVQDIERLLVEKSEAIICCSNYMVDHIRRDLGALDGKIQVIPNGVDVSRFNGAAKPGQALTSLPVKDKKIVLYVGRMVREKGIFTLLDAFEELRKQRKDVNLVFTGDGPLREGLEREVLLRGMSDDVHFTGFVDEQSLILLYKSSAAFVLPSYYEPFGIVALEAMASRAPVVASDVGGLSDMIQDGVTGLKVPAADPHALAKGLVRVLEDAALADLLRENAYRSVQEKYHWDLVADKTIETYNAASARLPRSGIAGDETFLADQAVLTLLLTTGATDREGAKNAREIASLIEAPEASVKQILGRQASRGYVLTTLDQERQDVRYLLNGAGIIKACSEFS